MSSTIFFSLVNEVDTSKPLELEPVETWPRSFHLFEDTKESLYALDAARAAGRPLLIRGETGTGKSQIARAAAQALGYRFISQVIDAQTEIEDLWYRYDAVMRLGQAQMLSTEAGINELKDQQKASPDKQPMLMSDHLSFGRYIIPGPMWWAYDFENAKCHSEKQDLQNRGYNTFSAYETNVKGESYRGSVLLLDEIDKAHADLANSLLESLGNGAFRVDLLSTTIGAKKEQDRTEQDASDNKEQDVSDDSKDNIEERPLVVLTSNDERQLPPAFMRRCVVLDLSLPKDENGFIELLIERAVAHLPEYEGKCAIDEDVLIEAAKQLWSDRKAVSSGDIKPGQAEYLDMIRVLHTMAETKEKQLKLLSQVRQYIYQKNSPLI